MANGVRKVSNTIDINELLRQGIAAAKAGQNRQARDLLLQVVGRDEINEQAWLWLSSVVESPDDRRLCLENVVAINPDNVHAQAGLRRMVEIPPSPPPGRPPGSAEQRSPHRGEGAAAPALREGEEAGEGSIPPSPLPGRPPGSAEQRSPLWGERAGAPVLGEREEAGEGAVFPSPPPSSSRPEGAVSAREREAEVLVERARAYLARMQAVPQAIELLNQAIEAQPANGLAYLLLGDAYLQQDNVSQAARYYSRASRYTAEDSRTGREARLKLKALQDSVQPRAVPAVVEYAGAVSVADMPQSLQPSLTYGYAGRPGCVTLYAALATAVGILALLVSGLVAIAGSSLVSWLQEKSLPFDEGSLGTAFGVIAGVGLLTAAVNLAIAAGLWRMKNWARITVVVTNILGALSAACPVVVLVIGLSRIFASSLLTGLPAPVWVVLLAGAALLCGTTYWFATNRELFD